MKGFSILFYISLSIQLINGATQLPDVKNFAGARIFHPAFPNLLTHSVDQSDVDDLETVRRLLSSSNTLPDYSGLPWKVLPSLGISDGQNLWSKSQIFAAYEKTRHLGHVVW